VATARPVDNYAWEKEFAPKISRGYIYSVAALYGLWIALMAGIAAHRWFGALQ
jgi:hypothetical protein